MDAADDAGPASCVRSGGESPVQCADARPRQSTCGHLKDKERENFLPLVHAQNAGPSRLSREAGAPSKSPVCATGTRASPSCHPGGTCRKLPCHAPAHVSHCLLTSGPVQPGPQSPEDMGTHWSPFCLLGTWVPQPHSSQSYLAPLSPVVFVLLFALVSLGGIFISLRIVPTWN